MIPVLVDLMIWGLANTAVEAPPAQANAAGNRDSLIADITKQAESRMVEFCSATYRDG